MLSTQEEEMEQTATEVKKKKYYCQYLKDDLEINPTKSRSGEIEATKYEVDKLNNCIVFYDETLTKNSAGEPIERVNRDTKEKVNDPKERIVATLHDIDAWKIS